MSSQSSCVRVALVSLTIISVLQFAISTRTRSPHMTNQETNEAQMIVGRNHHMMSRERSRILNLIRGRSLCPTFDLDPDGSCQMHSINILINLPGCQASFINYTVCAGNCRSISIGSLPKFNDCAMIREGFSMTSSCRSYSEERRNITLTCDEGEQTYEWDAVTDCRCQS